MNRDAIAALVPGGVPTVEQRAHLVAALLHLDSEVPEIHPDTMSEVVVNAARALLADMLAMEQPESDATPNSTYVERVARALCRAEGGSEETWSRYITRYRDRARDVLTTPSGWEMDPVVAVGR